MTTPSRNFKLASYCVLSRDEVRPACHIQYLLSHPQSTIFSLETRPEGIQKTCSFTTVFLTSTPAPLSSYCFCGLICAEQPISPSNGTRTYPARENLQTGWDEPSDRIASEIRDLINVTDEYGRNTKGVPNTSASLPIMGTLLEASAQRYQPV